MFKCIYEVGIGMVCLFVSARKELFLLFKAMELIDRIVKLGIRIAHLAAVDIELKSFDIVRVIGFTLCKRGYFDGMIRDECRLDEVFLDILLKEQIEYIALLMPFLVMDTVTVGKCFCLFVGMDIAEVDICIFFNGVDH